MYILKVSCNYKAVHKVRHARGEGSEKV